MAPAYCRYNRRTLVFCTGTASTFELNSSRYFLAKSMSPAVSPSSCRNHASFSQSLGLSGSMTWNGLP
eukprot:11122960-Karenia_brevis.AAC.1